MLKLTKQEPRWIDVVPDVRVRVRALTALDIVKARRKGWSVMREFMEEAKGELGAEDDADAMATIAIALDLAKAGIIAWEGVADADGNTLVEPTPEAIDAFMDHLVVYESISQQYIRPAFALPAAE